MDGSNYKYDVAFSFLSQDEVLATCLNDLLQDRFRTFLYSKKQGEIAGTDGEQSFNAVFGQDARLVVVLYRSGWGETSWTRIEQTAIRNRAFEHGYDFAKFLPLDDPPTVPKWLPRTQIWIGYKRWGIPGTASVIEARIEELGGEPHEESVLDRAVRLDRTMAFNELRKHFVGSERGVRLADAAFEELRSEIGRLIKTVSEKNNRVSFVVKNQKFEIVILGPGPGVSIDWERHYANSLDGARLEVSLWTGHPPFPGVLQFDRPTKLKTRVFSFDLAQDEQTCWLSSGPENRAFTTVELSSFILKFAMDETDARASHKRSIT